MTTTKQQRPMFQALDADDMDARLEAQAAEKGIPTLVSPKQVETVVASNEAGSAGRGATAAPTRRVKSLNVALPDYAWVALKTRAAERMVTVRHVILTALRAEGIEIREADMFEDGRRLRGSAGN